MKSLSISKIAVLTRKISRVLEHIQSHQIYPTEIELLLEDRNQEDFQLLFPEIREFVLKNVIEKTIAMTLYEISINRNGGETKLQTEFSEQDLTDFLSEEERILDLLEA